jgi:energy-coupling factor transporter ATP-binding protein EcfA2
MHTKIKNDLLSNKQQLIQQHELLEQRFGLLERKFLFDDDLSDIEYEIDYIDQFVKEKEKELLDLQHEFAVGERYHGNAYVRYGYKMNPFTFTVPFEKPNIIINQHESQQIAKDFINGVIRGSDANMLLIMGDQGVGKTHFLNYFANLLNREEFGKALAVTVRSEANKDMVDLYRQVIDTMQRILVEKSELGLADTIKKILDDSRTPRLVQDLVKILKEIEIQVGSKGYRSIFILVDEFENSLLGTPFPFIPQTISQLGTLTRLSGLGLILTIRKDDWNTWQEKIKERVQKIEKKYVIALERLSIEDSKRFILHRLEAEEFRLPNYPMATPKFVQDNIELITKSGNGNPRAMLRLANTLFRDSTTKLINLPLESSEVKMGDRPRQEEGAKNP